MTTRSRGPRTHHRPTEWQEVRVAQAAVESMQTTIRHADTKAATLLSVAGGAAVAVADRLSGSVLAAGGTAGIAVTVVFFAALATASWHFLSTLRPRLALPNGGGRLAVPGPGVDGGRPVAARRQRDEAWELVSALAGIAATKHGEIRRGLLWLLVSGACLLTALAIALGL